VNEKPATYHVINAKITRYTSFAVVTREQGWRTGLTMKWRMWKTVAKFYKPFTVANHRSPLSGQLECLRFLTSGLYLRRYYLAAWCLR